MRELRAEFDNEFIVIVGEKDVDYTELVNYVIKTGSPCVYKDYEDLPEYTKNEILKASKEASLPNIVFPFTISGFDIMFLEDFSFEEIRKLSKRFDNDFNEVVGK